MEALLAKSKDVLDVISQAILIVVPLVISWFIRTYVKNVTDEKRIGSIGRLSSVAIDYVENLEKRGALTVPEGASKGAQKLRLASEWLKGELKKNRIAVNSDEAAKWISSEFQNRVGGVTMSSLAVDLTARAVDLVQGLEKGDLSAAALSPERIGFLIGLATDWLVTQLATQRGVKIARDEAESRVKAEILNRLQGTQLPPDGKAKIARDEAESRVRAEILNPPRGTQVPPGDKLMDLAREALGFLDGLKQSGRVAPRPTAATDNADRDIAVAWVLIAAAKVGIPIAPDEIVRVVNSAFQERAAALHPQPAGGLGAR